MESAKCSECKNEERIRNLETGQVETRIYVKQINEDLGEIKSDIKEIKNNRNTSNKWYETDIAKTSIKYFWIFLIILILLIAGGKIADFISIIPK